MEENKELINKECEKKKEEYLAGWQRARADFLNYKKEEMQRIGALVGMSQAEIILKLLPILDNFDIIEEKLSDDLKNNSEVKGVLQIKTQIQDFLKKYGIEEVKSLGKKFDPNFHEVVEQVETKEKESGVIVKEIQKGYTLQGKIIRAAKVRVSK